MRSDPSFIEGYFAAYDYNWIFNPAYHFFKIMTDRNYLSGFEDAWARKLDDLRKGIY